MNEHIQRRLLPPIPESITLPPETGEIRGQLGSVKEYIYQGRVGEVDPADLRIFLRKLWIDDFENIIHDIRSFPVETVGVPAREVLRDEVIRGRHCEYFFYDSYFFGPPPPELYEACFEWTLTRPISELGPYAHRPNHPFDFLTYLLGRFIEIDDEDRIQATVSLMSQGRTIDIRKLGELHPALPEYFIDHKRLGFPHCVERLAADRVVEVAVHKLEHSASPIKATEFLYDHDVFRGPGGDTVFETFLNVLGKYDAREVHEILNAKYPRLTASQFDRLHTTLLIHRKFLESEFVGTFVCIKIYSGLPCTLDDFRCVVNMKEGRLGIINSTDVYLRLSDHDITTYSHDVNMKRNQWAPLYRRASDYQSIQRIILHHDQERRATVAAEIFQCGEQELLSTLHARMAGHIATHEITEARHLTAFATFLGFDIPCPFVESPQKNERKCMDGMIDVSDELISNYLDNLIEIQLQDHLEVLSPEVTTGQRYVNVRTREPSLNVQIRTGDMLRRIERDREQRLTWMREYLVRAISHESVYYAVFNNRGSLPHEFYEPLDGKLRSGTDEDIRYFLRYASHTFADMSSGVFGGKKWAVIAQYAHTLWQDNMKGPQLRAAIDAIFMAQHNSGNVFDKMPTHVVNDEVEVKGLLDAKYEALSPRDFLNRVLKVNPGMRELPQYLTWRGRVFEFESIMNAPLRVAHGD